MGGRPAKPIGMAVGARTKDEIEGRDAAEKALKSGSPPRVPSSLNKNQKKICKSIIKKLEKADILCSLDEWILAKTSVAIDKLLEIDREIEENPILKYDRDVMNSRAKYTQDFYRGCNELGLSPQARAKLAIASTASENDPLAEALLGDE